MTGYVSKTKTLYRNVFLGILFFMAGVFAIIFFLMKPKVKIDFIVVEDNFSKQITSVYYDRGELLTEETLELYNKSIGIHERNGYIFEGWRYGQDLISLDTKFLVDVQLVPSWVPKRYDVRFDLNGGEYNLDIAEGLNAHLEDIENESYVVEFRQQSGLPQIPTANGFVKNKIVGIDKDVYTHQLVGWRPATGGSVYTNPPAKEYVLLLSDVQKYNDAEKYELIENEEVAEEDDFEAEDLADEELESENGSEEEVSEPTFADKVEYFKTITYGEVVLTAEWEHKEINITVKGLGVEESEVDEDEEENNDQEVLMEYLTIKHKMAEPTAENMFNIVSREGYEIEGFYFDSSYSKRIENFEDFSPYEDTTIYVNWERGVYDVWFDALNGGAEPGESSTYETVKVEYGQKLVEPLETPQLVGYEFVGWFLGYDFNAKSYGEQFNFETDLISSSTTLFAKWELDALIESGAEYIDSQYYTYAPYSVNGVDGWIITGFKVESDSAEYEAEGERYLNENYKEQETLIVPSVRPSTIDSISSKPVIAISAHVFDINNLPYLKLKTVKIASSIINIHPQAFWNLPSLQEILVDTNNMNYDDDNREGVLYNKDRTVLIKYPAGKTATEYVVGEDGRRVEQINSYAFYGNRYLESITLNVEKVDGGAFRGANSLNMVKMTDVVKAEHFGVLDKGYENVFLNSNNITEIIVSQNGDFVFEKGVLYGGNTDIGQPKYHTIFNYFNGAELDQAELVVSENAKVIKDNAFDSSNLEDITLPDVKVIGSNAFTRSKLKVMDFAYNENIINFDNSRILQSVDLNGFYIIASDENSRVHFTNARNEKLFSGGREGTSYDDSLITIVKSRSDIV